MTEHARLCVNKADQMRTTEKQVHVIRKAILASLVYDNCFALPPETAAPWAMVALSILKGPD